MALPSWPDLSDEAQVEQWCGWLTEVWARPPVAEAVRLASPVLAQRLEALCGGHRPRPAQVRRMVLSVARYVVRMQRRSTPFGLFAGIAPLRFGAEVTAAGAGEPLVRTRADAAWLSTVIARLEASTEVLRRVPVMVNDLAAVRGERVVVSGAPRSPTGAPGQVSLRHSRVVAGVLAAARSPIPGGDLVAKLAADMPHLSTAGLENLLAELVRCGLLVTRLRPPSTTGDGLAHVYACLRDIDAESIDDVASLVAELHELHAGLGVIDVWDVQSLRRRMRAMAAVVEQPITGDCRFDVTAELPVQIAEEAAAAASALVRATPHPAGDPAMQEFHARFIGHYGVGAWVGLDELTDPTTGLGFPPHYGADQPYPAPDPRVDSRGERLLALAQQAALDGAREVELDEGFLDGLAAEAQGPLRPAPHAELCAEVHAPSSAAVAGGDFTLAVRGTSRSGLALSGRFIDLLPLAERERLVERYRELPTAVDGAVAAQLSFTPGHPRSANVSHAPRVLPRVLPLGEHTEAERGQLLADDLAVAADAQRLYVVSRSHGGVVEPVVANALARHAWPSLARLLTEIARSTTAAVSPFAWGAASCLPYLPRLRYRRSILCPARWRLPSGALPGRDASQEAWEYALATLREQLDLPDWISVGESDRLLRLNLDQPMDRTLLRTHLDQVAERGETATVSEAPTPTDLGWTGERAHEIVVPLATTTPPASAPALRLDASHRIGRDHGALPGQRVVSAELYGHPGHADTILIHYLPRLLEELGCRRAQPMWWFLRYRHPSPHLRLRLHPSPEGYGATVQALGDWAHDLRSRGLLGELAVTTYRPETIRYGTGAALEAAESVFAADSTAARAQISARHLHPRVVTAASMVDLATAMAGERAEAMHWLLERRPVPSRGASLREEVRQAVELFDPSQEYAALRALPGGEDIADSWEKRRRAAMAYCRRLQQDPTAPAPAGVLGSLLHLHHVRTLGIDPDSERETEHIARAVALAWRARRTAPREERP
ncbi:lantibiotic dehydratase [Streptomonospora salina]|uniref:Thiopeptide-type bacteriocin biosynthesis protein n=1 Tax=Streptomonospora salina TaxID=104205 RepID=A0A841ECN6_9ACTN|nr:lantibiotic dehydratase [Streptomonospora salina]MBB5998748.1 thiopeptide-type bacteriocin biosynthesis protein [Streptomonospora salina]